VVAVISFFLSWMLHGLDPWGFKLHNLLLHLLNAALLFHFLRTLLPRLDGTLDEPRARLIAVATVALWMLHPIQVSTVLYVVQRMTELSLLFTLLSLLAYLRARTASSNREYRLYGWVLLPLAALLAILSKETGVLLPFYLLTLELLAFQTTWAQVRSDRRLGWLLAVFVALPLLAGVVLLALNFNAIVDYSGRSFSLQERVLTQFHIVAFYLKLILAPRVREMSLFHDDFPLATGFDAVTLALVAGFAAALILAWRVRCRWPVVSCCIAMFLASHLLESSFLPLELAFEHRNYFGSAFVLLAPVWALFRFAPVKPMTLFVGVIGLLYAFMTATRASEWGNNDLFNTMIIVEHPRSPRGLNMYINYRTTRGELVDALRYLQQLAELTPYDPGVPVHEQVLGCALGQRNDAALERARSLLASNPTSVYAHSALQNLVLLVVENKCPVVTLMDVEDLVVAALESETASVRARSSAYLLRLRGIVALAQGYYAQGYSWFRQAHELGGDVSTLGDLLDYQVKFGRVSDAAETLQLIEQENAARFGIEQFQVDKGRALIDEARRANQ
jgi:tetratricopeptide (TPR) repeat protein